MVSRKQKFKTFILVLVLVAAIIGGVFGVAYNMGGVTFPWEVTSGMAQEEVVETEPEPAQPDQVEVEKEKVTEPEEVVEEPEEETSEETEDSLEEENAMSKTGVTLGYYGALHVEDGQLVDAEGNEVQLTGVSSHGINWYPDYVSENSIKSLREDWGVNIIRLAMYTSDYNGYCVGGSDNQEAQKQVIDTAVSAATDNDMYVIIDWHILNDSNPNEYKSEAIQFFGEMVRKYKDNENVIYEICNEPNGDTTWDDIRTYANEVIPVIRNVDKDALILVGTPSWSSDLASVLENPLDYDNIMYSYHFYASSHKEKERISLKSALDAGLPVFVSEYGLVTYDGDGDVNESQAEKWYELIDQYQLSSCIWNLSNKDEGSALIKASCDKTYGWDEEDLSDQGQYFFNYLKTKTSDSNNEEDADSNETESDSNNKRRN